MSLRKRFKRAVKKVARKAIVYTHKVTRFAAPIAGAVLFGPAGAAAGTALTTVTGRYAGGVEARSKGLSGTAARQYARKKSKRSMMYGLGITGAATGLALAGGTSLLAGSGKALGNLFGSGSGSPAAGPGELDYRSISSVGDPAGGGLDIGDSIYSTLGGTTGARPSASGGGFGETLLGVGGTVLGGLMGGRDTSPEGGMGDTGLDRETMGGGGFPVIPALVIGGVALLALRKGK